MATAIEIVPEVLFNFLKALQQQHCKSNCRPFYPPDFEQTVSSSHPWTNTDFCVACRIVLFSVLIEKFEIKNGTD